MGAFGIQVTHKPGIKMTCFEDLFCYRRIKKKKINFKNCPESVLAEHLVSLDFWMVFILPWLIESLISATWLLIF